MKRVLTALSALILSTSAFAGDWAFVGATDTIAFYVDVQSVQKHGAHLRAWDQMTTLENGRNRYLGFNEYDCANGRARTLQLHTYSDGKFIKTTGEEEWYYVAPNSLGADTFNIVCKRTVPDPKDVLKGRTALDAHKAALKLLRSLKR